MDQRRGGRLGLDEQFIPRLEGKRVVDEHLREFLVTWVRHG
jgi:hypothetical protein